MKEHKHAEVIRAYAAGHRIEWRDPDERSSEWRIIARPSFVDDFEYRVYHEPKPDVVIYQNYYSDHDVGLVNQSLELAKKFGEDTDQQFKKVGILKLTFDGNTGLLKAAEVVQ